MKNALYVKGLAIAIAAAFLLTVGNGLGTSKTAISDVSLNMVEMSAIQLERPKLDLERVRDIQTQLQSEPPLKPASVAFQDSFEDDVLGNVPDDPPWTVTEQAFGGTYPYIEDDFENDTVGSNPDSPPWTTSDGATPPTYWFKDIEDTTTAQNLNTYFAGYDGGFSTIAGDATLTSEAWIGTAPTSLFGFTGGAQIAHFNENVDTGTTSYFGPAGIDEFGTVTTAYAGCWVRLTSTTQRADYYMYDYMGGGVAIQFIFYNGQILHFPGGTQTVLTTYAANTWYEFMPQYNEATKTYSVWVNGVQYGAGSAWTDSSMTDINGLIWFGGDGSAQPASNLYIDNWFHGLPPSGGAHTVDVSNAWSYSGTGGSNSIRLDQNGYATAPAYTQVFIPPPYGFGISGASWAVRTSTTVANTNGATFKILDFNSRVLMALRFSVGEIQYQTDTGWVTLQAFSANTEYYLDAYMDATTKRYMGIWIDNNQLVTDAALVNIGAGIAGFRAEGTVSTQSEINFDWVILSGWEQEGTVRISDIAAHTGTQSVRMWEAGGDDYCDLGAYLGGDDCSYGDFWFWFYGDGTLGGGQVYVLDTTGTFLVTIISLGADLSAANIPSPGQLSWVDGDGAGGGTIIDGPTITPNTWNNVSIRYNTNTKSFEARWNGALQGTFGFLENGALDAGIVAFFGEGPAAPCDWLFDDIGLWVDDLPATPTNLRTYLPEPMPGTSADYFMDQDNAVQGTVTGTYANTLTIDATTQNIAEVAAGGGTSTSTYTYVGATTAGPHDAYYRDMDDSTAAELTTPNARTEATNAQYTSISTSNNVRWAGAAPGNNDEIAWEFVYTVGENPASVTQIDLTLEANWVATNCVVTLFAWNAVGSTWDTIGTTMTFATSGTDYTMTRSITTTPANYISGGTVRAIFYGSSSNVASNVDFAQCVVTYNLPTYYSLEHRWRTQNIPSGANVMKLFATGMTSAGADDSFTVGYSTVIGGPYTPAITINSNIMTTYDASLPIMSGQFYINIVDSNSLDPIQDTVYIDCIRIFYQDITGITSANEIATAGTPVSGTVTGAYTLTNSITPDGNGQQIAEVAGALTTFINNEQFTSGVPPTGWTTQYDGVYGNWASSNTANAGGTAPEARYMYGANGNGNGRLIAGPFDTTGFTTLSFSFRHFLDTFGAGCTLRVQTSTDMVAWTNTGWSVASGTVNVGPVLVTEPLDATENVGSATFYVALVVSDNSYQIDYWYVDSVSLSGTPSGYFATYRYTMQNIPYNTLANTLTVTARISEIAEPFSIGWSRAIGGPYTNVISVTSTTYTTYTAALPTNFDGSLFIQARDTLSGGADTVATSIYIDSLYVASTISPVNTTVNVVWDLSADDGSGQNDVTAYNVYYSDQFTAGTQDGPFNYLGSAPGGSTIFRHYGEGDDLEDNIWYIVAAEDAHSEGFTTMRATKFNEAPEAQNVMVDGTTFVDVTAGTSVALSSNIFDDSSTWEDILKIDGAEWYADADPGAGLGNAMSWDGTADNIFEAFTATIDTTGWTLGTHQIFVRGHEAAPGNTGTGWGLVSAAVLVNITGAPAPYQINLAGRVAGEWVFVSFPVEATGNIDVILNDAINGDSGTTWDVAKWFDGATQTWMSYRATGTQTLTTVNNQIGVWLHLTANGGDTMLTLGGAGSYPATAVNIDLHPGWNMVGYPSATPQLASATLPAPADIVSVWQAASPFINDLAPGAVTMTEGNAYWVHVTSYCTWTVNP